MEKRSCICAQAPIDRPHCRCHSAKKDLSGQHAGMHGRHAWRRGRQVGSAWTADKAHVHIVPYTQPYLAVIRIQTDYTERTYIVTVSENRGGFSATPYLPVFYVPIGCVQIPTAQQACSSREVCAAAPGGHCRPGRTVPSPSSSSSSSIIGASMRCSVSLFRCPPLI
jgi:hypothetical protein